MAASIWIDYPMSGETLPPTFTAFGGFDLGVGFILPPKKNGFTITVRLLSGTTVIQIGTTTTHCPDPRTPNGPNTQWQATFTDVAPASGLTLEATLTIPKTPAVPPATSNNLTVVASGAPLSIVQICPSLPPRNSFSAQVLAPADGKAVGGTAAGAAAGAAGAAGAVAAASATALAEALSRTLLVYPLDFLYRWDLYPTVSRAVAVVFQRGTNQAVSITDGQFQIGRAVALVTYRIDRLYSARIWLLDEDGALLLTHREMPLPRIV